MEEEADESLFWLELSEESDLIPTKRIQPFKREANELTAIFTATGKTAKRNAQSKKSK